MTETKQSSIRWVTKMYREEELIFATLLSNGAILYEIVPEGDGATFNVWFTPEEHEEPIFLWHFCSLDDAKRYVERREENDRMLHTSYTYSAL